MDILSLAAAVGVALWAYSNYQRNKKKIARNTDRIVAIEKHLNIEPPPAPVELN